LASRLRHTWMRGSTWLLVSVLLAGALLAGCGGESGVTYTSLLARPEGHLYYPGSKVVQKHGEDERWEEAGQHAAMAEVRLNADAPMSAVLAWYRDQLKSRVWTLRSSDATSETFSKGSQDLFFVIPGKTFDPAQTDSTYSIRYYVVPAPCASVPAPMNIADCG